MPRLLRADAPRLPRIRRRPAIGCADTVGGVAKIRQLRYFVAPTAAGEALLVEAREAIERLDAALETARRAAHGEAGRLRVGFEAAGAGRLSTQARARFLAPFPRVRVEPRRFEWGGAVAAVREGD
jgi:DNA-binding transcriptional LysR family regulator